MAWSKMFLSSSISTWFIIYQVGPTKTWTTGIQLSIQVSYDTEDVNMSDENKNTAKKK